VGRTGKQEGYFGGKARGKRPLGKPRYRWVDNIKMNLGERGWGGMDRTGLAEGMELLVAKHAGNS
jgi:hypothetical protein